MVIIVCGLPGSGKSFFASRLADLLDVEYIKSDSVRVQLFNRLYSFEHKTQVYDAVLKRTKEAIKQKRNVVVDATFYKSNLRKLFRQECEAIYQVHIIEVMADEWLIRERLKTARSDSDADFEVYKKIKSEWEPLIEDHLVLQSTNSNVKEMLDKASEYLRLNNDKRPG